MDPPLSLHWDGSALLYSTEQFATGAPVVTLSIGKLGEVQLGSDGFNAPYAISTIDRDDGGAQVQLHSDDYFSGFNPPGAYLMRIPKATSSRIGIANCAFYNSSQGCGNATVVSPPDTGFAPVGMARTDGYQIGDVTIQGVRAYDPSTAQWVSPDAYVGTTTDPGSQNPFMWNGNNPIAYSDPSGYKDTRPDVYFKVEVA